MPVIMNHHAYPYCVEMITCFNQMGLAVNCEAERSLARHFFQMALDIAREHQVISVYAKEHNNIGLTYHDQDNFEAAVHEYEEAEVWLSESESREIIYPMVYGNWTIALIRLRRWTEALDKYQKSLHFLPEDQPVDVESISLGMIIYYSLGMQEEYQSAKKEFLSNIEKQEINSTVYYRLWEYHIGLDDEAFENTLFRNLNIAITQHPERENWKSKSLAYDMLYSKAEREDNLPAMLEALKQKERIQAEAILTLEKNRQDALSEYMDISAEKQEALEHAESATRAKSQFLSNMSHDIRTPMNAIYGITQLMEYDREDPEKMEDLIQKLQSSSQHLLSLINDVLDMSRIESGEVMLNQESIGLTDQISQLKSILCPQAEERKQEFTICMHHIRHEYFLGDAVRLRQVLINLLSNAVKYTPCGGKIRLDLTERSGQEETGSVLEFSVTDTGCGMSEDFVEHIFEPFTRAESSLTNKVQGTGLGMAITRNIVELMGGTISVQSTPGKGSCFTVVIPMKIDTEAQLEPSETQSVPDDHLLRGMRFLCAEDNALNAEILEAMLDMEGASCTILSDGRQIADRFRSVKPGEYTAILMDMQMPVMNGLDAARAIRSSENPLGRTIPIIAMTANAFSSDVQECLDAGMDAHLSKPLDLKALRQTIHTLMEPRGGRFGAARGYRQDNARHSDRVRQETRDCIYGASPDDNGFPQEYEKICGIQT